MENKPRNPWIAGLLAFVTIGLGHIYSGEVKKGLFLYFGQGLVLAVVLPLLIIKPDVVGLSFSLIVGLAYFVYNLIDAVQTAKRNALFYSPQKINKWYVYLAFLFLASFIIQPITEILIKRNIIQAYKIPSSAMAPTLRPGDRLLVNKLFYKTAKPQRGDIIVFEFPEDPSLDYVKRLVGIEGDVIEMKNKKLYVNNVEQGEGYIVHTDSKTFPASEHPRDNFGPITVPNGSFFFLGDNRDNSYDSRYWGFVSRGQIHGKVMSIYWSWDNEERRIRWDRIGERIE